MSQRSRPPAPFTGLSHHQTAWILTHRDLWRKTSLGNGSQFNGADSAASVCLSASANKTITWTGGDPTSFIRVTLIDDTTQIASPKNVWYASASDGSITLSYCTGGVGGSPTVCTYGLSPSKNAQLTVDVLPPNGIADTVANILGISQQVRFSWAYHYVFGVLTITN